MWIRICLLVSLALIAPSKSVVAQSWSFDARTIALGGVGGSGNLATKMIDEQRDYTSIVLPFGLFQVLKDFNTFDPGSPDFDPVRAIEYASRPIHYVVGRDTNHSGEASFVNVPIQPPVCVRRFASWADRAIPQSTR